MAFGRRMAAFNRLATNRVLSGVAPLASVADEKMSA